MRKTKEQRVRQSICAICGETARPGRGTVIEEIGKSGRVHTVKCLAIAQDIIARRRGGKQAT